MSNRIEMLRTMAGMKPVDLASKMGVGERTVVRWERERTSIPDEHKLALAGFFEVSVDFLMGWETEENGNGQSRESETTA